MAHRETIKQLNKSHKHGRHKTKGQLARESQGRVNVKVLTKKRKGVDGHADRRNLAKQMRSQKREKFIEEKRQRGGQHSPPHFVVVVSLSTKSHCSGIVNQLTNVVEQMEGGLVSRNEQLMVHASIARFKQRLSFYAPQPGNLSATLDAAKVADAVLFVTSLQDPVDEQGQMCIKCLQSQGLPEAFFVCEGLNDLPHKKMIEARKQINKEIEILFPGQDNKVQPLDSQSDLLLVLRKLTSTFHKQSRPNLIAERITFDLENETAEEGTLKVSGYLRGADLSADRLVHVVGWGTYQMSQVVSAMDPHPLVLSKLRDTKPLLDEDMEAGVEVLATPDPSIQESLQFEFEVDMFQNEDQTWPTKEELAEADEAAKQREMRLKKKLLAKGLSDYQANWLFDDDIDDDNDDDDEESDDDEDNTAERMEGAGTVEEEGDSDGSWESMDEADDSKSVANTETDQDVRFDPEAEKLLLKQLQEERLEQNNPDEVEIAPDISARERFARYRGLASFRTSPWNKNEELPIDYQRIVRVGDTNKLRNRIRKAELTNSVMVGQYLTVHIKGVPKAFFDAYEPGSPLVVFGLLPFEQRMSVLHFAVRQDSSFTDTLRSKAQLTFQVGFRRFSASALFSTHRPGDKQLMLRYFPQDEIAVMSIYGPVTFGPCPVLVFKKDSEGKEQLVAKGSLLTVDPDRLIIKRSILRGHQFKMGKRKGVVRFMFFNREDIEYFKKIELKTKLNRRGRILEPLGTHGHMKCFFNGQPRSQDIVFMHLYKRVYPKWTFQPEDPTQQPTAQQKGEAQDGQAYVMFD